MFFDVFALGHVGHALLRVHEQLFRIRVLQPRFVGHHQPAAEGVVLARFAVHGYADIHFARVLFFGGLGQRVLQRTKNDVVAYVFLARNGFYQHQHFTIHFV